MPLGLDWRWNMHGFYGLGFDHSDPCCSSLESFHSPVAILDPEKQRTTNFEARNATFLDPVIDRPWADAITICDCLLRDQVAKSDFLQREPTPALAFNRLRFDAPRLKFGSHLLRSSGMDDLLPG